MVVPIKLFGQIHHLLNRIFPVEQLRYLQSPKKSLTGCKSQRDWYIKLEFWKENKGKLTLVSTILHKFYTFLTSGIAYLKAPWASLFSQHHFTNLLKKKGKGCSFQGRRRPEGKKGGVSIDSSMCLPWVGRYIEIGRRFLFFLVPPFFLSPGPTAGS